MPCTTSNGNLMKSVSVWQDFWRQDDDNKDHVDDDEERGIGSISLSSDLVPKIASDQASSLLSEDDDDDDDNNNSNPAGGGPLIILLDSVETVQTALASLRSGQYTQHQTFSIKALLSSSIGSSHESMMRLLCAFLKECSALYPWRAIHLELDFRNKWPVVFADPIMLRLLVDTLRRLAKLEEFSYTFLDGTGLGHIAEALSKLPNLKKIKLDCKKKDSVIPIPLAQTIAKAFARMDSLEDLSLSISSDFLSLLEPLTRHAPPLLRSLRLLDTGEPNCSEIPTRTISESVVEASVPLISRQESSLEYLGLDHYDDWGWRDGLYNPNDGKVSLSPFAAALETNTKLQTLDLGRAPLTRDDLAVFWRVLETKNFTLSVLKASMWHLPLGISIDQDAQDKIRKIQFYLDLNKFQRKRLLLEGATREEWINVIMDAKDNASVVFFYLSKNPDLLLLSSPSAAAAAAPSLKRGRRSVVSTRSAFSPESIESLPATTTSIKKKARLA